MELTGEQTLAQLTGSVGTMREFLGEDNLALFYSATPTQTADIRRRMLDAQWQKVLSDPYFKWLASHASFKAAHKIFERKRKYRNATASIKDNLAPFRFLYVVSLALMVYTDQCNPSRRRRLPNNRTAQRALNCIRFLYSCDLGYLTTRAKMEKALGHLELVLEASIKKRQTKQDRHYASRCFVQCLVYHFLSRFGQTLHLAVRELCGLIDYHPGDTTLEDTIKEVKGRQRREVAHS